MMDFLLAAHHYHSIMGLKFFLFHVKEDENGLVLKIKLVVAALARNKFYSKLQTFEIANVDYTSQQIIQLVQNRFSV